MIIQSNHKGHDRIDREINEGKKADSTALSLR